MTSWQYTWVHDLVDGCVQALGLKNEVLNLISPEETTVAELAHGLAERYGFQVLFEPEKPEGPNFAYMSARKAIRQMGWKPTTLWEGIGRTVVEMRRAGFGQPV